MKIEIIGQTNDRLSLCKAIKEMAGIGLKEAKDIMDEYHGNNKPIVFNVNSFEDAMRIFTQYELHIKGLKIRKFRVDIIQKLLRENDPEYKMENEEDYEPFLEAFNFLYKRDKQNLRELIHITLKEYKTKKIDEYLHVDKSEANLILEEIAKLKI